VSADIKRHYTKRRAKSERDKGVKFSSSPTRFSQYKSIEVGEVAYVQNCSKRVKPKKEMQHFVAHATNTSSMPAGIPEPFYALSH